MQLILPERYVDLLEGAEKTEKAIKAVKDMFQNNLSAQLALLRVTAPMVVLSGTGLNDELNGVERPVRFPIKDMAEQQAEVVHSLAKWKRAKLAQMGIAPGRGIYTDMNALRPDEELDNIHSIYVDQWGIPADHPRAAGRYPFRTRRGAGTALPGSHSEGAGKRDRPSLGRRVHHRHRRRPLRRAAARRPCRGL